MPHLYDLLLITSPALTEEGRYVFGEVLDETGRRVFGPMDETGRFAFPISPSGVQGTINVDEQEHLQSHGLLAAKYAGQPAFPAVHVLPVQWEQHDPAGSLAGPPPFEMEETEGLPAGLQLLTPKAVNPEFPAVYVLPTQWEQNEQATGLFALLNAEETEGLPASLHLLTPKDLGRPPLRAIVLPGVPESNDQNPPLFFTVDFPYDTLTGTQPIVDFPYDVVGNVTFVVAFPYDVNPGPTVNTRFPYDVVQPTPTWTSPIARRSGPS